MTIFQCLYTVKVPFENEPELSKYNDQSKHLLAKYKYNISMIKNPSTYGAPNTINFRV